MIATSVDAEESLLILTLVSSYRLTLEAKYGARKQPSLTANFADSVCQRSFEKPAIFKYHINPSENQYV